MHGHAGGELDAGPLHFFPHFFPAMSSKAAPVAVPITFDLPVELIAKVAQHRQKAGLGSTSEVVRLAIREFDFGSYRPTVAEHRQVSVRLTPRVRGFLVQMAKKKKVSVGELLRAALEALPVAKGKK